MRIHELYLKNFGKFSEEHILIQDDIHLFYGENEYGKSTIYAFIKAMLFGLERGRGRASQKDAFSRYEPWCNPNYYAGMMRFSCSGRNFRLDRNFDRYGKSATLICEDDGEELSVEHGDLEMLLDGMTASTFENTLAIGQLSVETDQELAGELKNFAANYYETGDGAVDLQDALLNLRIKKKEAESELKRQAAEKAELQRSIGQELHYIENDIEKLKEELKKVEKEIKTIPIKEKSLQKSTKIDKRALCAALILFLGVIAFWVIPRPWNFAGAAGCLIVAGALAGCLYLKGRSRRTGKNLAESKERESDTDRSKRMIWQQERVCAELQEKQVQYGNLKEKCMELQEMGEEPLLQERKKQVLELAEQRLLQISKEINGELSHSLNEKASHVLDTITEGKYTRLIIDESLHMYLLTGEKKIPIERVSRGTIEQVYFALRMAAADLLYKGEFPIILDDTFALYDDKRLRAALKWLKQQSRQVILFTCQKREGALLDEDTVTYKSKFNYK